MTEIPRTTTHEWKGDFLHKRSLCLDGENRSHFEIERDPEEDEDIMSVLSRAYEVEYDRWAYQIEPLQRECRSLWSLTEIVLGEGLRAMAHLQLVDYTRSSVYPYLTDPDAHSLAVLAATASLPQALSLLGFMADRLSRKPRFSIHVPPKGVAFFEMIFQLPFLVFRTVSLVDVSNGPSLEGRSSCTDLSFLAFDSDFDRRGARRTEYPPLCESTFSCFIHGWDVARWTAYGLFDTYFDKLDCKESATQYFEDSRASEPYFTGDPLTFAQEDLNMPVSCPRHYFLRVLESRMVRVRDEWGKVVSEVLEMVQVGKARCHVAFQPLRLGTPNSDVLSKAIEDWQHSFRQIEQWNIQTRDLLIRLMRALEKTVASWKAFGSKDIKYLYQEGSVANIGPDALQTLTSVEDLVSELDSFRNELHHQVEVFEKGSMQEPEQHIRDVRSVPDACGSNLAMTDILCPVSYNTGWQGGVNITGPTEAF
ncbi:hypothetical protein PG997_000904 [Apiospora hydei]|uniref:Uncharacterized protein n=1 Tax=Apiospora hydei TaxID=1337664 RepID=A0ABR1XC95_9PEZI